MKIKVKSVYFFIIVALVARVTIFNRVRSTNEFSAVDASGILEVLFIAVGFFVFALSQHNACIVKKLFKSPLVFLLLYYILCTLSAIWSFSPLYSGVRGGEMVCLIFICLAFMLNYNGDSA